MRKALSLAREGGYAGWNASGGNGGPPQRRSSGVAAGPRRVLGPRTTSDIEDKATVTLRIEGDVRRRDGTETMRGRRAKGQGRRAPAGREARGRRSVEPFLGRPARKSSHLLAVRRDVFTHFLLRARREGHHPEAGSQRRDTWRRGFGRRASAPQRPRWRESSCRACPDSAAK